MKKKSNFSFLFILFITITSCGNSDPNNEIDEGNIKGEIYESKEIGWTIEIPKGWEIVSRDQVEAANEKGSQAMEKVTGQEVDTKTMKNLISFQKDKFNLLGSTSEPFVEEYPNEYLINNQKIYEILYDTFKSQGIKADTSTGKELVDNLEFDTFYTTIYSPKGEIILNQVLYGRLINGLSFGVTICYNNPEDKNTLLNAWRDSKFKKTDHHQ
ncbi:MAG: hypothetical protein K0S44_1097 [Bacteroidetes bacterium]|jgi:hypothetical protein|nr:hypothetical protein [Bacteroidota bacterium]